MGDKLSALLGDLANQLLATKNAEAQARAARIAVEEQIIAKVVSPGDSGQKIVTLDDGTKIVIKKSLSYKADLEAIENVKLFDNKGNQLPPPVKYITATNPDNAGYECFRDNHKAEFIRLQKHVTVTLLRDENGNVVMDEFGGVTYVPMQETK